MNSVQLRSCFERSTSELQEPTALGDFTPKRIWSKEMRWEARCRPPLPTRHNIILSRDSDRALGMFAKCQKYIPECREHCSFSKVRAHSRQPPNIRQMTAFGHWPQQTVCPTLGRKGDWHDRYRERQLAASLLAKSGRPTRPSNRVTFEIGTDFIMRACCSVIQGSSQASR